MPQFIVYAEPLVEMFVSNDSPFLSLTNRTEVPLLTAELDKTFTPAYRKDIRVFLTDGTATTPEDATNEAITNAVNKLRTLSGAVIGIDPIPAGFAKWVETVYGWDSRVLVKQGDGTPFELFVREDPTDPTSKLLAYSPVYMRFVVTEPTV